ncbi:aldose 1-epimerase family protein [Pseudostreptobacillus hongkongensis]|uniref:aldose 1-epimerase family protein n=1 Tax=Pseudostreptobacillus hongkongensis TaxID=1162717 RepID=UPI000834241D|nr:aldose 1-epimerase family protein [Pseudostreptobacillus hongkongensis]
MVILKKGANVAHVLEKGAEIKSFTIDGEEFLWNKEEFWAKTSPILFPFVGGLRDNKYEYKGKEYTITTRHGFARDNIFEVVEKHEDRAIFKFSSNEETLEKYPFNFDLFLEYILTDNGFELKYKVVNLDKDEMYFSIGAHPAFALQNDYEGNAYIEFEVPEDAKKYKLDLKTGFYDGMKDFFSLQEDKTKLEIVDENFVEDAISFKNLNSTKVYIKSRTNKKEVMVDFKDFPYIAFWKPLNAPFVCIEPWYGINDILNTSNDIIAKEGIQKLNGNSEFNSTLKFEFKRGY